MQAIGLETPTSQPPNSLLTISLPSVLLQDTDAYHAATMDGTMYRINTCSADWYGLVIRSGRIRKQTDDDADDSVVHQPLSKLVGPFHVFRFLYTA